jgi:hypothetical protein
MSFMIISISPLFARPPSEILVDYRTSEKLLVVEVAHLTHNSSRDFIKKIVVEKSGMESRIFYFGNQQAPKKQVIQMDLEALPSEEIIIEAQCIQGGLEKLSLLFHQKRLNRKTKLNIKVRC